MGRIWKNGGGLPGHSTAMFLADCNQECNQECRFILAILLCGWFLVISLSCHVGHKFVLVCCSKYAKETQIYLGCRSKNPNSIITQCVFFDVKEIPQDTITSSSIARSMCWQMACHPNGPWIVKSPWIVCDRCVGLHGLVGVPWWNIA